MTSPRRLLFGAILVSLLVPACAPARPPSAPPGPAVERSAKARACFARLAALGGAWERVASSGRRHTITYRLLANGTALVEQFAFGDEDPNHESMTVYSLDGDRLIATHYCLQGNQPRLVLTSGSSDDRLTFEMVDGTNLHERGKSHQQSFTLELRGDELVRAEHYVDNDGSPTPSSSEPEPPVVYHRVAVRTGVAGKDSARDRDH